jgi:hypothetical protein
MSEPVDLNDLFEEAQEEGLLSPESAQALVVHDIGAQIQAGLGVNVDDVDASEVILLNLLIDDSGSIRFARNSQAVRDGHNIVVESVLESKQQDNILVHARYLNGTVLYPYCSLEQAVKMDQSNYNPMGGTPLYDESVVMLGTVLAKTKEFSDNGVPVRSITLIMSDGEDTSSRRSSTDSVKQIVEDMLRSETHIIAGMGFDNTSTNFTEIFKRMGLLDQWILTPQNNEHDIRRAFQVFSKSAVQASQSAMNFSKTAMGGFGG